MTSKKFQINPHRLFTTLYTVKRRRRQERTCRLTFRLVPLWRPTDLSLRPGWPVRTATIQCCRTVPIRTGGCL